MLFRCALHSAHRRRLGLRLVSFSFLLRTPPESAPREAPTPLVFVSSENWDASSSEGMSTLATMLADKGFTCLQVDLERPSVANDSRTMIKSLESELKSAIALSTLPFPPVIVARGTACLVAQTYISSYPAHGMVLISPPTSNQEALDDGKLPTPLPEFIYEPQFPIAVIDTPGRMDHLQKHNRLCKDRENSEVDLIFVQSLEQNVPLVEIENWLDHLGI